VLFITVHIFGETGVVLANLVYIEFDTNLR